VAGVLRLPWRRSARTVLIVSEHQPDPALNSAFLRQADVRLLTSCPGDEALELARRERPGLIIQDIDAPDDDGFEFCRRLQCEAATRSIPLMVVAAREMSEAAQGVRADAVLLKPLARGEFFKAVRRFVSLPRRRHLRYGVNLRFSFRVGDNGWGQAFSRDVSSNGAFLKTDRILPLGARLEVHFRLPGV
jgi:CheY-like chemotaxis protein